MIEAKNVTEEIVKQSHGLKYIILIDHGSSKSSDMIDKAINLFANDGWKCITISAKTSGERLGLTHVIYVLMEKI